jgi:AraC-like DNA-binding protein
MLSTSDHMIVRIVRSAHIPGLEITHYPCLSRGWRFIPEAYTPFLFIKSLGGDVDFLTRGMRTRCRTKSVAIGEAGEPCVLRPRSPMLGDFRVVSVDNQVVGTVLDEIGVGHNASVFTRAPQCDDPCPARSLAHLFRSIGAGGPLDTEERLFAFLTLAARRERVVTPSRTRNTPAVRHARELLHVRFDAVVSLDELARAAGTGKFTLLRAFARELGITPHAYQVQLRMARACRLLARGVSPAEAALAVGYSEQSALQRPFTRLVGVTPGEYAHAIR